MKQNFIQNQSQIDIGLIGQTQIVVADKNGNIKYQHFNKKNAITSSLLGRLAYAMFIGTFDSISDFGTAVSKDGFAYFSTTVTAGGTIMSCASVSANITLPYVIWSGSRTISHNG